MNKIAEAKEIFFVSGPYKGQIPHWEVIIWVKRHMKIQATYFCTSPLGHIGNPCVFCEQFLEKEDSE